jgi:hypothetical protein
VVEAPLEEAPELFGDVEIGELPTYDLTGEGRGDGAGGPTLAPRTDDRPTGDGVAGPDETDATDATDDADDAEGPPAQ